MTNDNQLEKEVVPVLKSKEVAPVIWGIGSILWKVFAVWSNIDFILSIREGKLAAVFEMFLNWGWIVVLVLSSVWFAMSRRQKIQDDGTPTITGSTVFACAGMAFLFGVLITVYGAGSIEQPFVGWGGSIDDCFGTVDMSRLQGFESKYDLAMVCVMEDPNVDKFYDTRIAISALHRITPGAVSIEAKSKAGNLMSSAATAMLPPNAKFVPPGTPGSQPLNFQLTVSRFAILLPRGKDVSNIRRLADVEDQGGKILSPLYYH